MDIEQLNKYIENYLNNDKTNSAIMLTGDWGTGKSYYIKNDLIPHIDERRKEKCVIVSLYGIKDLNDISKSIYLELRAKKFKINSESVASSKLVAKTIFKGVTSFLGVDLKADESALQDLYESVDLTDKLIILEDLERCSIDITEVLGYVNNLVEQDGVKVLLVANEKELVKVKTQNILIDEKFSEAKEKKQKDIIVTESKSQDYKKIKEKTVSDTIVFYTEYNEAIENIIKQFDNGYFNRFLEDKNEHGKPRIVDEIEQNIMSEKSINNHNLRSFIFACQKTVDMFNFLDDSYNEGFLKHIFLSNVAFCLKLKANESLHWKENNKENYSSELATFKYPLYRVSYDFIKCQIIDIDKFKEYNDLYVRTRNYEIDDEELYNKLHCIYSFYFSKEEDVIVAIGNVLDLLKSNKIPLTMYGKLANYLIAIKSWIGQEEIIENCKQYMLNNLIANDAKVEDCIRMHDSFQLEENDAQELADFKQQMLQKLKSTYSDSFDFDYSPEKIDDFYDYVYNNRSTFVSRGAFAVKIDTGEFVRLLENCSAEQILKLRRAFHIVYSFSNDEYFIRDKDALLELKNQSEVLLNNTGTLDKIQKKQLQYFCDKLQTIIDKLPND